MFKVTLDSSRSVEVQDQATATLVNDSIERLTKRTVDAEQATIDAHEKMEKANAEKDAVKEELEEEKKKSSDSAIESRVKAIAKTTADAIVIAGADFTCDSMDTLAIQRAALTVNRPTIDWACKEVAYVQAAFDMAIEAPTKTADQLAQFSIDAAKKTNDGEETKLSSYDAFKDQQANAWKMEK